jgi:membrane protein YdbS with pleckstrin-like domain
MNIFIHRDGEQFGPYSEDDVLGYLRNGSLVASDFAWHEGAEGWTPLGSLPQFARFATRPDLPLPPSIPPPTSSTSTQPHSIEIAALPDASLGLYAASTLQPGEKALHKTALHWIMLVRAAMSAFLMMILWAPTLPILPFMGVFYVLREILGGALFLVPFSLIFTFVEVPLIVRFLTSEFVITDKRIILKTGFIGRHTTEIFISKIESVSVGQSVFGRIFDFGTVTIKGTGGSAESFANIAGPIQFRNSVQRIQSPH